MFLTWSWLCSRVGDPLGNEYYFLSSIHWDKRIWDCDRVSYGWTWKSPAQAEVTLRTDKLPFLVSYIGGFGPVEDNYHQKQIIYEYYYNIILAKKRYLDLKRQILFWEERY